MESDMRIFVEVVDRGSFSAAAAELGLTPSAVSKLVSRLEGRLGTRLLHRTTRRLALTPEGETYLLRARDILSAIADAEAEVSRTGRAPRGRLRVTCTTGFALHHLSQALPNFVETYPEMQVELSISDRVVDLLFENVDVGIRTGTIVEPTLIVRRIVEFERTTYAAPVYLKRRGRPETPDDLAQHDCVAHGTRPPYHWPFFIGGQRVEVPIQARLAVDNAEAALRIGIAGGGIVRIADMLAGEAVRSGQLVHVLKNHHVTEPVVLSAVYPYGRQRMPKVRAFLDFLTERVGHQPWKQGIAISNL